MLTNLGTPDSATAGGVRTYLAEFLHDNRVVDLNRFLWCPLLHGIILRVRPKKIAKVYAAVWTEGGAPLMVISRKQQEALRVELERRLGHPVKVVLAMRYGNPSIKAGMNELETAGLRKVVVLPLYPQYCSATIASTFDGVANALRKRKWMPEMRFVHHYHDNPEYIKAVANTIRSHWKEHGEPERLMFSFHGMPTRFACEGDFYFEHCDETARAVALDLGLEDGKWFMTFQSRFGKEEWLQPYTDKTLEAWGEAKVGRVDVVCPGFAADCLETLEEMAITNREVFEEAGGGELSYIPALNDRPEHIELLANIVERHIKQLLQ